ncbi:MAG: proton-conducting transporter membrane subunit [Syntrophomonadaceae bacterium]|nr:proton-conducting transporter membrane subunit [Syntrophomonadaceae bacterium]
MITGKYLLAVSIWLPVLAALFCLLFRSYSIRNIAAYLTGIILAACSIGMLLMGPFDYQPQGLAGISWNMVITGADFILLAFILYIGIKQRHSLITILAIAQALLLVYFDFVLGGGHASLKPAFVIDNLAIIMALIINIVGSLICIYGVKYIAEHEEHHPNYTGTFPARDVSPHLSPGTFPCYRDIPQGGVSLHPNDVSPHLKSRQPRFMFWLIIFLGAMNGIVFSNNLYWMFFFWEVTTFCSFQLIGHDLTDEAIGNACRALWMNSLGGVAFAAALVLLLKYGSSDFLSMRYLLNQAGSPEIAGILLLGVALMVFAGLTKSAQLPFQSWLLGAMVAPTPVSALLHSSTMVKAGVYLILRLAPVYAGTYLSDMVAVAGGFTFLVTSILAISQSNAKRVLAYSTIANLGLIIACAGINTPVAISAAIVLIIFHAVSKGLLFLCTGFVEHNIGSRDIEDMEGLADRMPITTVIYTVGIISMFLPPFGMLIGKWAAIEAAAELPLVAFMMVMASAVTGLFWIKWLGRMLQGVPGVERKAEPMEVHYKISLGGLAAGAVLLGLFVVPLINRLVAPAVQNYYSNPGLGTAAGTIAAGGEGAFVAWPLFALILLVLVAAGVMYKPDRIKQIPVYMCGENSGGLSSANYISTGETNTALNLSNYYFTGIINEFRWNRVVNSLALIMIIVLLGVTIL